jgi:asparagine synthase (glutamine-hydrolysing)
MCGIAGIVRYDMPGDALLPRVIAMRDRLRHRGPDGHGEFAGKHAALAHTRLALLDPTGGAQPMTSPDGRYTLVYNGELYELDALRSRLAPGWRFRTRTDAEVVLAAFAAWGPACVRELEGMFAFFVWDAHEDRGFGARDLLGVKPFVYALDGGELAFASEAKALLSVLRSPPRARLEALLEYLVAPAFSGVERPMFEGLESLAPGHRLEVTRAGVSTRRWGEYAIGGPFEEDPARLGERLAGALDRAVRRTLVADAPIGVFLSGGLDSTILAALARRAGATPRGFTVRFQEQASYDYARSLIVTSDDTPFARLAAERLALPADEVPVDRAGLPADLAHLAAHNDALPAWEQEIAQHHLARAAARHCKAVLVGDAADETHYGYHFLLDPIASSSPGRLLERFADPPLRAGLLPQAIDHFDDHYRALARDAGHRFTTPHDCTLATTWLIVNRWLPRLLHNGDIHGMAHSLELRVPFADRALLDVARTVPPRLGLRDGVEKALLRDAVRGVVPEQIRVRKKSALPKDQGSARIYQREAARLLDGDERLDGLLDRDRILALCDPARVLDERERALLFGVIGLAHWARAFEVRMP